MNTIPGARVRKPLLVAALLLASMPIASHAAVWVSINIAPPPLPVYVQPVIPTPGYLWTPGYWRWNAVDGDYFWVPGIWVAPPYVGALWTPGYWGWGNGLYAWHRGYWGDHIGFYGGVNYGYGYVGHGYVGGYWLGGVFNYNRTVNNVNTTIVHNVYNKTVVQNNTRVSFNGGQGGIAAQPSQEERAARSEQHTPLTASQHQHEQVAMRAPAQRVPFNHDAPTMAAMPQAGAIHGGGGGHAGGGGHSGVERTRAEANWPHDGRPQSHAEMLADKPGSARGVGGHPQHHEGGQAR